MDTDTANKDRTHADKPDNKSLSKPASKSGARRKPTDADDALIHLFAANLRHFRKTRMVMTQEQFAAHCDFDRTYISGLERRTRNPSIKTLQKLAKFLGIEPHELIMPLPAEGQEGDIQEKDQV